MGAITTVIDAAIGSASANNVIRNRCGHRLLSPHALSLFVHMLPLLVLQLLASVSGFEPDFLHPLQDMTVAQGRDATFTCVVNNLGGYRVSGDVATARVAWIKADTKAILAIHDHVITNNARLSVKHNDFNTWTLTIRGVRREDRGQYMCQVNTDPMKMQTAFLEVVVPPDIIYEETSGDMMVPEGGSAKLICKARGHPKPKITWRREDGGPIASRLGNGRVERLPEVETEVLALTKVTRSEMGAYLCLATNNVPPAVSKRMMLHVHFHPLIQVPNQLVGAPISTDVTLQCHVEASPKAINYWTRESGEMIITNDKYHMTETTNSIYSVQMKLIIRKFQKLDLGGYKCISKNSIGDAEGNIRLYEMEIQQRVDSDEQTLMEEDDDDLDEPNQDTNGNHYNNGFQGPLTEPAGAENGVRPDASSASSPHQGLHTLRSWTDLVVGLLQASPAFSLPLLKLMLAPML